MKRNIILAAVLAAYFSALVPASAQGNRDRHDQGQHNGQRDDRRDNGRDDRSDDRYDQRRNDRYDYRQADNRGPDRGAGPRHDLRKGGRLPAEYRNRQYVVDDWRGHRLSAPPRGYHWVQTGGDYVLVAISTGIILQLLLNN